MKTPFPFYSIENTTQFPKDHTPEVQSDLVSALHLCFYTLLTIIYLTIYLNEVNEVDVLFYLTFHNCCDIFKDFPKIYEIIVFDLFRYSLYENLSVCLSPLSEIEFTSQFTSMR